MTATIIDTVPNSIEQWCEWWSAVSLLSHHAEVERIINNNNFNALAMNALKMKESNISSYVAHSILFRHPDDLCHETIPSALWYDIAFKLFSNNSTVISYLPNLGWHPKSLYYTYGRSTQTQEPVVNAMLLLMEYTIAIFYKDVEKDPVAVYELYEWGRVNNVALKEYALLFQNMYDIRTIKWADALNATLYFVQNKTTDKLEYTHTYEVLT